jgi:nitrogen fixation NifU-like protein
VCGDEIRIQLRIEDDHIEEAKFVGQGCSISQAAVSMMTDLLKGKSLDEADALAHRFTELMHGDEEAAKDRNLGDLRALQGVSKFPVRIKCALLGFDALQEALKKTGTGSRH